MMDMHEVKGCSWDGLGDEGDICRDEIGGANLVDKDGGLEVVSFSEELIEGVGKLRGEDYSFPLGMVSSDVEVGHGIVKASMKIRV